ncbi:hypothetical protein ASG43_05030 [Aureimonas sp. Leaf454]|uniref:acetate/propionate family kinase n=1 Tax=Aureimonas sp. Leaf454 TaxID=1736381 RepID=UPI000701F837|nr:acetate/propionate family kinase [Aureimonas sp. Leaf454]KQT50655.1 hypothetical protein ASG43_05030 [Aureimonas sp. Leaf454]
MADAILAINAGSSSIKFALYRHRDGDLQPVGRGAIEDIGATGRFHAASQTGESLADETWDADDGDMPLRLLGWIEAHLGSDRLVAVGHRIVHGGTGFTAPVRLTRDTLAALATLTPLAPLHQKRSLGPAVALAASRPDLLQVGCFDTAFHATIGAPANRYGLPRALHDEGIRKFGFHGLSYQHVAGRLSDLMPGRRKVVAAHLGSGASLCALLDGRSVDTTMGFSALDGLVMATRCGSLDPGIVLYLLQEKSMSVGEVETLLYRQSGLEGVSGLSSDLRRLVESRDPHAGEAVDLFVFRAAREIAALAATLQGLDGLVFTGGVGEHLPCIRARIADRLGWLGVRLNTDANAAAGAGTADIADPSAAVACCVVPADEELVVAQQVRMVLNEAQSEHAVSPSR